MDDKQVVSQGHFNIKIAAKEPQIRVEEFQILMRKVQGIDKERNRVFLMQDMDRGVPLPSISKEIQHEILCSMDTPNLKVSYRLEAAVCHESFGGEKTEVPSVFFPVIITRDAKGAVNSSKNEYLSTQVVSSFGDPVQT